MKSLEELAAGLSTDAARATAESIRAAVTEVFGRRGWKLEQLPGKRIWTTEVRGASTTYRCYLVIDPELGQLVFYGVVPHTVPLEARVESAVAVAAVNYDLAVGKFELDLSDGELRYSTGIEVNGTRLDPVVLDNLLARAVELLDGYTPALKQRIPLPPGA